MNKIIEWWNSSNLEFQDKYTILLIQVNNGNKEAKKVMKLNSGLLSHSNILSGYFLDISFLIFMEV